MKKYVAKYRSNPELEWKILRNSGSVITIAENETDAKERAIDELTNQLQKKARKDAMAEAFCSRNYELADKYPYWQDIYEQVQMYDWLIEDWH